MSKNKMECSICYETISSKTSCNPYNCNHHYHIHCIKQWSGLCPCCRSSKKQSLVNNNNSRFNKILNSIHKFSDGMLTRYAHNSDCWYSHRNSVIGGIYNDSIYICCNDCKSITPVFST